MNGWEQTGVRRESTMSVVPALVFAVVVAFLATGCGTDSVKVTTSAAASGPTAHGRQLAGESCSACHGQEYEGVKNLGPALSNNGFIRDHTDDELIAFVKEGRLREDPDNETGIAMPPYGGNPRLSDDDLADIVLFLRTIQ